jgi:parallel beta-helix repeat protein
LTGCGYQGTTTNGGSAFWFANYPSTTDVTRDVAITDCFIHDNNWHAIQFSVTCGVIAGCSFRDNKESHIFCSRLLPNSDATDILIANNTFDGVTKKDISAHAIETGAVKTIITGNTIRDSDHGGIALTDVQDAVISDNVIVNSTLISASGWGAIDFICDSSGTSRVRNVSIRGNRVYDDQGSPTTRHAVRFQGGGDAALNCSIVNNDFAGTTFSSGIFDLGTKGATTVRKGNLGSVDNYPIPALGEFQTPAATGSYSVTGLTFKPVRIEFLATIATGSTAANQSNSIVNAAGTAVCHGFSAASTPTMNSTTHGNVAIKLTDTAGGTITNATFTSYNSDGFTLNFTTVTSRPWIRYVAYPE